MSDYQSTQRAIGKHFTDNVTTPLGLVTLWPNQVAIPPGVTLEQIEWCRVSFVQAAATPVVVQGAAGRYRIRGEMIVSLHVPGDDGADRANELADSICDIYRGAEVGAVTFETAEIRQAGVSGHWWQVNVYCPFFRDEVT